MNNNFNDRRDRYVSARVSQADFDLLHAYCRACRCSIQVCLETIIKLVSGAPIHSYGENAPISEQFAPK